MAAARSSGGSFNEIIGHCYLTSVSNKHIKYYKFVAFRGIINIGAAIFFSLDVSEVCRKAPRSCDCEYSLSLDSLRFITCEAVYKQEIYWPSWAREN